MKHQPTGPCECSDPGCNTSHKGISKCIRKAVIIYYRADMEDLTGTAFCDDCADDAGDSGLFYVKDEEDEPDPQETRYAWRCSGRTSGADVKPCDFQTLKVEDAIGHFERTDHDSDRVEISADCDAPCFEDDPCPRHCGRSVIS